MGAQAQKQLKDHIFTLQRLKNVSQDRVSKKKEILQRHLLQYVAMKSLIVKNKLHSGDRQRKGLKSKLSDEKITFPFLLLENTSKPLNLNMSKDLRELKVSSNSAINVYGDVDVLFHLNLHKVSQEFFEAHLDPKLRRFLPENCFRDLEQQFT